MGEIDLQYLELLIGQDESSILGDYLEHVANEGLTAYKTVFQWGEKRGESLYTHILNGIFVLDTLREILGLTDAEARVLYTAFTVHDLNKVVKDRLPFGKLATREHVATEIERLKLAPFFPAWQDYLDDIVSLIRAHSGHYHSGGERWNLRHASAYRLGLDRVNALVHLMRAADIIDLSHTLKEQSRKADFLGHLNAYLSDSGQTIQYEFFTHQLTEQRGLLTNIIHNAITEELSGRYNLIPILFYPDGVAYLVEKGGSPVISEADLGSIARHIADDISKMTKANFRHFIKSTGQGIKVDPKCLAMGVPFSQILEEIYNLVQRRRFEPEKLEAGIRQRLRRALQKGTLPPEVTADLEGEAHLVCTDPDRLRIAELLRSYYIFLNTHFRSTVLDAWQRIYTLMELPSARKTYYTAFDARYDRAYVVVRDLNLSEEEVYRRIANDGTSLLQQEDEAPDPKIPLFVQYLQLYVIFGTRGRPSANFEAHLSHYVRNQHKQCVYCSGPFPTAKWMTADVRGDLTVQTFSNRLRGGPGEPKKYVCAICQLQFLLEKLAYPPVRDEKLIYLHLYPYSFLTRPFIEGLRASIARIVAEDTAVKALNMQAPENIQEYLIGRSVKPAFRTHTKKGTPQPYGIYVPHYAETVGNLIIFPINPAGGNDTERFLFALWNALLLQRYFGVKVLMSNAPVPPLGKEDIPDLYVDNIPLACQGLLPRNDYAQFEGQGDKPGALQALWEDVAHLFALRGLTFVKEDKTAQLVRALFGHPLNIFYETDRLLEAHKDGKNAGGLQLWRSRRAFPHVKALAMSKGGKFMAQLSQHLNRLAEIAWKGGLRGSSLKRSSLLYPLSELFDKLNHANAYLDRETLKAAAVQDIFDHLTRIADERYKPGQRKWQATKQFVDIWFQNVLDGVYGGNLRKLLADEKLIRSAYLFYIREQIPQKEKSATNEPEEEGEA